MTKPPGAGKFCDILAACRSSKINGYWEGSIYRHHPCGIVRGNLILCNEWNTNDYCYASVMTEPGELTKPSNHPTSWGGDPHIHPVYGEEFIVYRHGSWYGEDGPWRKALITLIEYLELELDDLSLKAEWKNKMAAIDRKRKESTDWDNRRAAWSDHNE